MIQCNKLLYKYILQCRVYVTQKNYYMQIIYYM